MAGLAGGARMGGGRGGAPALLAGGGPMAAALNPGMMMAPIIMPAPGEPLVAAVAWAGQVPCPLPLLLGLACGSLRQAATDPWPHPPPALYPHLRRRHGPHHPAHERADGWRHGGRRPRHARVRAALLLLPLGCRAGQGWERRLLLLPPAPPPSLLLLCAAQSASHC